MLIFVLWLRQANSNPHRNFIELDVDSSSKSSHMGYPESPHSDATRTECAHPSAASKCEQILVLISHPASGTMQPWSATGASCDTGHFSILPRGGQVWRKLNNRMLVASAQVCCAQGSARGSRRTVAHNGHRRIKVRPSPLTYCCHDSHEESEALSPDCPVGKTRLIWQKQTTRARLDKTKAEGPDTSGRLEPAGLSVDRIWTKQSSI
ncbi:hypothetical protein DTO280E4_5205 [Paecilomyces variotii]|nr:hypothetical protein DTO032I3_3487 [Paecilomyces variotii]KAJ9276851.1 hypothetical protein DTO021D3_6288 [Paecilomyces variotii]KAJ9340874.1 hypothetical protein DTO027B6_6561 [Paecilomyces variotii]KAJ9358446.1 hypothetical protein DTO280E4_5205 [Paecilomyces variotii]KAJ9380725.1 hypothetical protein DTO032I4_6546 [Paecilomyces variotii]